MPSAAPDPPRAMANVKHPDFARLNRPENEIGISTNRHEADRFSSGDIAARERHALVAVFRRK